MAMPHQNPSDDQLRKLLTEARTIAIVGASSSSDRPSHGIMKKMLDAGYRVIPVNPRENEVLGQKAYGSLLDVPEKVDIVDVFRRAEDTPPIADDAVAIGAKALWLQSGIVNEETARRAWSGGLMSIMDMCIGVEHSLLQIPKKS
jgi:predicted CoA-binding protein